MEYETKAQPPEVRTAFDDFLAAFEQFKQANDDRLAQLERRSADVVTEEKVDRINKALDDQKRALDTLLLDASRPSLSIERKAATDRDQVERKSAFDRYVRKGDAAALDALELKTTSFSAGSCWRRLRRSAPSPRCARSAETCTASPSPPPAPPPAGSPRPTRGRRPTRRRSP